MTAFFCTIAGNLEPDGWGSRFPVAMGPFYEGDVAAEDVKGLRSELAQIHQELSAQPPDRVIWNLDDLSRQPPWGNHFAPTITDLGNYFVTMEATTCSR